MSKIAFLFTGQGAQFPGMMKEYYDDNPDVQKVFETANRVLGRDIRGLCFEGTKEELNLTRNTQPCMLAADLAAYAVLRGRGIKPSAVSGFSLGEYAALVAAGVLSMEEAFRLIQIRADAMQEAVPVGVGGMASLFQLTEEEVRSLCEKEEGYVAPANYNSPLQIAVSGEKDAVRRVMDHAAGRGLRVVELPVSAPFHCRLMQKAADKMAEVLETSELHTPEIPVYMNVDARVHTDPEEIRRLMALQVISPVYWFQTIRAMAESGVDRFLECGPGHTLKKFVNQTLPEALSEAPFDV